MSGTELNAPVSKPLLTIDGLSVEFGPSRVVDGLGFSVAPGRTMAVVGESGSGKSITSLSIMRLADMIGARFPAGRILFNGSGGERDLLQADQKTMRGIRGKEIGLIEDNDTQIRLFEQHAGETGFRIVNGFPCLIGEDNRHTVPLTLITEYPDETIYGEAFVKGHTAQMETVLSAYDALQALFAHAVTV